MASQGDVREASTPVSEERRSVSRKRPRTSNHVSKACDGCRERKTRCDALPPVCGPCTAKGVDCTYQRADGRKLHRDNGNGSIREQLDKMMSMLAATRQPTPPPNPPASSHALSTPTPGMPTFTFNPPLPSPTIPTSRRAVTVSPQDVRSGARLQPDTVLPFSAADAVLDLGVWNDNPVARPILEPVRLPPTQLSPVMPANDLLKRAGAGAHMQYGPTSFWSYATDPTQRNMPVQFESADLGPGDWVDWARHLPPDLKLSKKVHDAALSHFGAYFAPWCMAVNMPAFLRDLEMCNLVTRKPSTTAIAQRTSSYSPLLHNCALHLGLHLNQEAWPALAAAMNAAIAEHCASMLIDETDDPKLSTPRALALFASCMNVRKEDSAHKTGYIHFGMAFASVQALGVNVKSDHLVEAGQLSSQDRDLRNASYWAMFQQDLLRSICAGRPCMLSAKTSVPLPAIDVADDDDPWLSLRPGNPANHLKSMRSTVFHWSAKLACLIRHVVDVSDDDRVDRDLRVALLLENLHCWYNEQPFRHPELHPVPHLLVMHMMYHLTLIYLLRPYFRAASTIDPPPAYICEHAAEKTTELLRVFEGTHGLRNGVATIIPVIFATATIRLLSLVSSPMESARCDGNIRGLDECIRFMDTIAFTWIEARRGLEVIKSLKREWIPYTSTDSMGDEASSSVQPMVATGPFGDMAGSDELAEMLREWHSAEGVYDMSIWSLPPFL